MDLSTMTKPANTLIWFFFLIDAHALFISLDTSKVLFYLGQLLIGFSFGEREM